MDINLIFIISLICSIGGVLFFIYSLFIIKKIRALFPGAKIIKKWTIIQLLILIFLVGYVFNIIFLILEMTDLITFMTAIVYIFGALFVYIVINLAYNTYKLLIPEIANDKK